MGSEAPAARRRCASPSPPRAAAPKCGAERPNPAQPLGPGQPPGGVGGVESGQRPRSGGGRWDAGGRCGPLESPGSLVGAPMRSPQLRSSVRCRPPAPKLTPRGLAGAAAQRGAVVAPGLREARATPVPASWPAPLLSRAWAAPAAGSGRVTRAATPRLPPALPMPLCAWTRPLSPPLLRGAPSADPILQVRSCGASLEKAGPCLADSLFRLCTPLAGAGGAKAFVQWGGGAEWGNT